MLAFTDVETTGTEMWRNEIIEIATVVTDDDFKVLGEFNEYVRPEYSKQYTPEAEEVHGITWHDSQSFSSSDIVLSDYIDFLSEYRVGHEASLQMVCHALPFYSSLDLIDRNFIFAWFWNHDHRHTYYSLFDDQNTKSTIIRSKKLAQQTWGVPNQKLSTWMNKLGLSFKPHRALDDAYACLEVYKYQKTYQGGILG